MRYYLRNVRKDERELPLIDWKRDLSKEIDRPGFS